MNDQGMLAPKHKTSMYPCQTDDMSILASFQVLQQSVDRELNLYSDLKERTNVVAQVMMLSLSSQPVDHEENGRRKLLPAAEAGEYCYNTCLLFSWVIHSTEWEQFSPWYMYVCMTSNMAQSHVDLSM